MIGNRISAYEVLSELGSGGMGAVYLAECAEEAAGLDARTKVALKVIHPHLLTQPGFFKRFLREAQIGQDVQHENVVRTYDCDATDVDGTAAHFLVMEYVEGQTLRDLLDELERVPEELCRHIGCEVAKGLAAIHDAGVVHRDIKPENVLITQEHVVKVMDLGVARLQDEAVRLSQAGAFVGSLEYAAPEQFRSAEGGPDGRADLHALGVLLYEVATGQHPYRDEDASRVIRNILDEAPRKAGEVNPQLSPFFEDVVGTLMAKDRAERFGDAASLARVLEEGERGAWWKARSKALRIETKRPLRRIRVPRETALYGRESDLAKLHALFDETKAGDGRVLLIEGEAGIGKTRLVDEFVGQLRQDGEEINFLFGSYPPGGAATTAGAFSEAYREQFGGQGSAPWLAQTPLLVPAFDALLRGEPPKEDAERLTKDSLGTVFVHATRNLATERPTIVLIDDLHFAPEDARSLFMTLALAAPGHPILLVGTMRPGVSEEWVSNVTRLAHASHTRLSRLGPKDLVSLLKDSFRSERLAHELGTQIAVKSDGNPFFAFEIIRGLREGQFITQEVDGTWISTRVIDDIQIPSSVMDLIQARLGDLSDEEKDLLDVAACCGFEFDPLLLADVLGLKRIPALKRLARIEARHRLVRSAGEHFVFDHHQVQEALYRALPPPLAREYHAAIAEALATRATAASGDAGELSGALTVDLCEHYLKGAQGEKALRHLDAALDHLEKNYLNDQAISLADRALEVKDLLQGNARVDVLLKKNARLELLARREAQEAVLAEAGALAQQTGNDERGGKVARALGVVHWLASRFPEAEAAFRRSLELARACGDAETEAQATGALGIVFNAQGRLPEAKEHFGRSLALSRAAGHRRGEVVATGNLGIIFRRQGRLTEAEDHTRRFLALNREIGDRPGEGRATGNLGNILLHRGHLIEAREHYERSLTLAREAGDRHGEAVALAQLAGSWSPLGELAQAQRAWEQSVRLCREMGARHPEGYGLLALGQLAAERGDLAEALRLTEASLALRREIGHGDGIADSLLELGDLHRRANKADLARAALDEALPLVREQERPEQVAGVLALLACLPGGDAQAAEKARDEAGDIIDAPWVHWLLHQATGDRAHLEEAKRLVDEALSKVPEEYRESMRTHVRLHREIMEAWHQQAAS